MTKDQVKSCKYWLKQLADAADPVTFFFGTSGNMSRRTKEVAIPDFIREHIVKTVNGNNTAIITCFVSCLRLLLIKYAGANKCIIITTPNKEVGGENIKCSLYLKMPVPGKSRVRDMLNAELQQLSAAWQEQEYDMKVLEQQAFLNYGIKLNELSTVCFLWDAVQVENVDCFQAPLCVQLRGEKDGLWRLVMRFDTIWPDEFADQFMEHYLILLDEILRVEPETTWQQLPILTTHAQQQLLTNFSRTGNLVPPPQETVMDEFYKNVAKDPSAKAAVWNNETMTYGELDLLSGKLAGLLLQCGVQKGDIVILNMPACFELVIAQLAILKMGALILPVDPVMPAQRLQLIIAESRAKYMLVKNSEQEPAGIQVILADLETIARAQEIGCSVSNDHHDNAYIIYTSGSTGKPKGVVLSHKALAAQLHWLARYFKLGSKDVIPQKSSIGIIDSIFEILGPLSFINSAVYLKPYEDIMYDTPDIQVNWLQSIGATWVIFVPALLTNLQGLLQKIPTLKTLVVSGEEMREPYAGGFECYNAYGLSECAGINTIYRLADNCGPKIPVGVPIDNSYVLLLDENRQLIPPFVIGDLYVGGPCVGNGFLHDDELTKDRFIKDPFDNSTIYKTGDKAWWTTEGQIMYIGRKDRQVKIRGVRVDLNEIEQFLEIRPEILQAAVIFKEGIQGNQSIIAFIVPAEEQIIDEPDLRNYLAAKIHVQAIPNHIFVLPQLPLTSNGKIDRVALSKKDTGRIIRNEDAPKGRIQETIAEVWEAVLNTRDIGVKDNFFDLGGHSINITLAAMRINEKLHAHLRADDIMRHPTVEQLARMLDERINNNNTTPIGATNELQQTFLALNQSVEGNSNLIMLHPFAGLSHGYLLLGNSLQGKVNVYGINAKGLFDNRVILPASIEEVAHDYIQLFKEQGIRNNLYICGYSASAPLAFEITKQLEYQKIPVKKLFIVDDYFKAGSVQLTQDRLNAMEVNELTWGLRNYFKIDLGVVPWSKDWLEKELNRIGDEETEVSGFKIHEIKRCKDVIVNLFHCLQQYRPVGKVNADMIYFYTDHYGIDKHWKAHAAGQFNCVRVEGMHSSIFLEENIPYNSIVFQKQILTLPVATVI